MTRLNLKIALPTLVIFFASFTAAATAKEALPMGVASHHAQTRTADITFKSGKIIEVAFASVEGGKEAQLSRNYFPKIMPLAAKYGGKMLGSFKVTAIVRGDIQPQMIAIFEWPSLEARDRLLDDRQAQKLFPIRDDAMTFFKQAFYTTDKDITVTFRQDKTYEFFNAWLSDEADELLPRYFAQSAEVKNKYGPPKFVASLTPFAGGPTADYILNPHMFGIVEWNNTQTYYGLAADPDFKKSVPLLNRSLTRMDMMHATFNFPK
ncbi:MAG: hypothetical protein COB54_03160 [Alphaproteobacteria bacterium]|nr:MAG: hypothetical protein COB54_03160 [Alphaproteobacteria bacterium]